MENVCRTCLAEDVNLEPINSTDLLHKIKTLSSIEIDCTEPLPSKICLTCIKDVNSYYKFREKIIESDKLLRDHIDVKAEPNVSDEDDEMFNFEDPLSPNSSISEVGCKPIRFVTVPTEFDPDKTEIKSEDEFENDNKKEFENEEPEQIALSQVIRKESELGPKDENSTCFSCPVCNFETRYHEMAQAHAILCAPKVNCSICGKTFKETYFRRHLREVHKEQYYSGDHMKYSTKCEGPVKSKEEETCCPHCDQKVVRGIFGDHMKIHIEENEGMFFCWKCPYKNSDKKEFIEHRKNHSPQKMCNVCGAVLTAKSFHKHMRNHKLEIVVGGEKIFLCKYCDFNTKSEDELKTHKKIHVKRSICSVCGDSVTSYNMNNHMLVHNGGTKHCNFCNRDIKATSYRRHIFIHTEQENTCKICGEKFTLKSKYSRHLAKHRVKKYACTICDKTFKAKSCLDGHIRSHTGERPFPCIECGKHLSNKHALKSHMRQHTKEKPYTCSECPKAFTQRVSLRTHMKSQHNIELPSTVTFNISK